MSDRCACRATRIMPDRTTAVVQRYLDALAGDTPAEPLIRALLDRAVGRLELLCADMLYRSYPRLTRPPLQPGDGRAARRRGRAAAQGACATVRPRTVRQFFALANQHMRWELNDLARRLDEQARRRRSCARGWCRRRPAATRCSRRTPAACCEAIDGLPEDEREAFDLVRIQGLTQAEAAEVLGVSVKTVQRRLNRGLRPAGGAAGRPPAGLSAARGTPAAVAGGVDDAAFGTVRRAARWPATRACSNCSRRCSTRADARKRCAGTARSCCPRSGERLAGVPPRRRPSSTRCSRPGDAPGRRTRPSASAPRTRRCRRSPATRCRGCWAAAAWASSTGPGTCASTAPSP